MQYLLKIAPDFHTTGLRPPGPQEISCLNRPIQLFTGQMGGEGGGVAEKHFSVSGRWSHCNIVYGSFPPDWTEPACGNNQLSASGGLISCCFGPKYVFIDLIMADCCSLKWSVELIQHAGLFLTAWIPSDHDCVLFGPSGRTCAVLRLLARIFRYAHYQVSYTLSHLR